MSLILDALKKLEQETAARKQGMDKVADQILRCDQAKPQHKRIILMSMFSAIVGAVIAVALFNGFFSQIKTLPPAPPASITLSKPQSNPISVEASPSQIDKNQSSSALRTSEIRNTVVQTKEKKSQQKTTSLSKRETKIQNKAYDTHQESTNDSAQSLTVSGVVWFDDRRARRAVVNDMVVGEGTVVKGAKIVEIQPNGVRFSRGEKSFYISLGKSF